MITINHDSTYLAGLLYNAIHRPQEGAQAFRGWLISTRTGPVTIGDLDRVQRAISWQAAEKQVRALRAWRDDLAQERAENEYMAGLAALEHPDAQQREDLNTFCKATGWTVGGLLLYYRGQVATAATGETDLLTLATVRQIRQIAADLGVPGVARLSKEKAIAAIKASGRDYRRTLGTRLEIDLGTKIEKKEGIDIIHAMNKARLALHDKHPALRLFG